MAFQPPNDNETTPKSDVRKFGRIVNERLDPASPYNSLPTFSTPPSRTCKIENPFDSHLIESLHLPTCSPSIFTTQMSTPKSRRKFKWTIDDISHLKPADIDESTISQHVFSTDDLLAESDVQKKIDTFFNKTEIVPSPLTPRTDNVNLIKKCNMFIEKRKLLHHMPYEVSTQTTLTLPPKLPEDLEKLLKPYFINENIDQTHPINEQQQQQQQPASSTSSYSNDENIENSSLYKKLFETYDDSESSKSHSVNDSSSPIKFSNMSIPELCLHDSPRNNLSALNDCNISPISKSSMKLSRRRFSSFEPHQMSDVDFANSNWQNQDESTNFDCTEIMLETSTNSIISKQNLNTSKTSLDSSMEYKQISFNSPNKSDSDQEQMEMSFPNTPNSKLFTSIRKRLSESFKFDEQQQTNSIQFDINGVGKRLCNEDAMFDAGYCTQEIFDTNNSN